MPKIDVVLLDKLVKKKKKKQTTLLVYKVTPQPRVSFHLLLLFSPMTLRILADVI